MFCLLELRKTINRQRIGLGIVNHVHHHGSLPSLKIRWLRAMLLTYKVQRSYILTRTPFRRGFENNMKTA